MRLATPAEVEELKSELLDVFSLHAQTLAEIAADGDVAGIAHKLAERFHSSVRETYEWDGVAPVWAIRRTTAERVARAMDRIGDKTTARWLCDKYRAGRLLVFTGEGSLLVNFERGRYSFEPDSLSTAFNPN